MPRYSILYYDTFLVVFRFLVYTNSPYYTVDTYEQNLNIAACDL